ncbi:hypothetical protein PVAND_017161 [Polypedilum vanderplanki]|uniref:Ubiquitin carboxyl-terminal hydrolase n=1 Tax=Polypedilum vanderplanki TaxID=319348 RepID=A0A9J6BIM4_POLVA|nr:hypothetical protein PVAND_017161 [Polypedilum vanderplanki]
MSETFVIPIESNPEVLNKFLIKLGVSEDFSLTDVYGLDPDLLAILPQPVLAFILLFPCSENYYNHRHEENEKLKEKPQKIPENLFYMHQFLRNACGTIALFHAVLNNLEKIQLKDGAMKNFYEKTKNLSPEDKGRILENDQEIIKIHQSFANEGQTEVPNAEDKVYFHFIALTRVGDNLMELDGTRKIPINHGKTSDETFMFDAAEICKKFINREKNDCRFTIMALAASCDQ